MYEWARWTFGTIYTASRYLDEIRVMLAYKKHVARTHWTTVFRTNGDAFTSFIGIILSLSL